MPVFHYQFSMKMASIIIIVMTNVVIIRLSSVVSSTGGVLDDNFVVFVSRNIKSCNPITSVVYIFTNDDSHQSLFCI